MATQLTAIATAEMRRRKADLKSKLKELAEDSGRPEELLIEYAADPFDQIRSSTDREMAVQRLDRETRLLHDIQSALAKIEDGTYGLCERCDQPIPRRRLDVAPWVRLCVPCQSAEEAVKCDSGPAFANAA
jgi:DnaK suppressor protein